MKAKYVDSGKVMAEGDVIYNRMSGGRGRPSLYIKKGVRYVSYKTPKTAKTAAIAEIAGV